jgi:LacI family transcriptional regulator
MMMKPSLQEIAELAGVSTATVSRALNDRPGVNPDTRETILRIARELDYMPNVAAKSLATSRTFTLGCINYERKPQPISSYHVQIVQGIDYEARQRRYHVITTFVDARMMSDAMQLPLINEQRVDGLILVGPALKASFIIQLHNSGIPIVLVDNLLNETTIDAVVCDTVGGTYRATRHLIEVHNRRKLVFLSGPADWFSSRERRQGYEQALREIGQEPRVIYMPDTTVNTGHSALLETLKYYPDLEGIVTVNDATAVGVIRAAKDQGRQIPQDIAIVGFDNVSWGPLHNPPLTTVRMFKYETGIQAARRLIDVIERESVPGFQLRLGTELIVRESCGCEFEKEPVYDDHGS